MPISSSARTQRRRREDAGAAYLVFSDYLAPGAAPIRQRQRLDNSGDALPVSFEQAGVQVDLASNALAGGDITVERHVFHPCSTEWRLQMPIWTIGSSKHHNAPDGSSTTNLVFHYTDAQVAGMDESSLAVWSRPSGAAVRECMVPGSSVTASLNLIAVSGLTELGYQYTLAVEPSPTAVGALFLNAPPAGAQQPSAGLVWAAGLLALVAALVYWLRRRARSAPAAKSERLQGLALHRCRGFVRRSDGQRSGSRRHAGAVRKLPQNRR